MVRTPSATTAYQVAATLAQRSPRSVSGRAAQLGGRMASMYAGDKRVMVERNHRRIRGTEMTEVELGQHVARTFEAYARYYLDSFRLPSLDDRTIDEGFDYVGFENIAASIERGVGPILVMPHLGGWEWAAFWLAQIQNIRVTAVVEPLEPPELFDWFLSFRESLGMNVVPVGPTAGPAILDAINEQHVVCLLADRVVSGAAGVPVDFLGERTMLPAGPATVALRTGAPLLPTAVFFRGDRHFAECRPPIVAEREGKFREDVQRVTQLIAHELERFIRAAPEQWHVLQPGWPSDFQALGRPLPKAYKGL